MYFTGDLNEKLITADHRVSNEYERMRKYSRLITDSDLVNFKGYSLKSCLLNIRSLKKHSIDLKMDQPLNGSNLIFFTETQMISGSDLSSVEMDLPSFYFQHNFSNNHRFSSLASANDRNVEIATLVKLDGTYYYIYTYYIIFSITYYV